MRTISGTRPIRASTTAGKKLAVAVPEEHRIATGSRLALAMPSAKKELERSSRLSQTSMSGCRAIINASGVERDPGAMQTLRTPERANSSTNAPTKANVTCSCFNEALLPMRSASGGI